MIPFQFNKKSSAEQRRCVEKYKSLLLARANKKKIEEIDDWCQMNLSRSFWTVIMASYKELCELKEKLDELDYEGKYSLPNSIKKYLIKTLDKKHVPRNYLIDCLDVTVCPYCNRAYINRSKNHTVCQLDHFFDKAAYPIMAVSFYNLIPSCGTCNLTKKQQPLGYSPYDPQFDSADQLLEFGFTAETERELQGLKKVTSIVIQSKEKCMEDNIHKLELPELYQIHRDIVQELLYKKMIYSEKYVNDLKKQYPGIKIDPGRLVIGNYTTPDSYGKRPLAKMMADIGRRIKLID